MHELLATLLITLDRDTIASPKSNPPESAWSPLLQPDSPSPSHIIGLEETMNLVLDRRFVEHDVYQLFCRLMEHVKDCYEWRAESVGLVSWIPRVVSVYQPQLCSLNMPGCLRETAEFTS